MAHVRIKENESPEVAMRRFKRSVEKEGTMTEVRKRQYYEKPSSLRQQQIKAAIKRRKKREQRDK